jgi:putative transposase
MAGVTEVQRFGARRTADACAVYRRAMARIPRCEFPPEAVFHVTARGVDGTPIVRDRRDGLTFLSLLADAVRRFRLDTHAFCLMPNHLHLVVDARRDRLSSAMHRVLGIHAQRFNRRHGRKGHLFGDRFWTQLVRSDEHLAAACAYVVHNLVRAELCAEPAEWPWLGSRYGTVLS